MVTLIGCCASVIIANDNVLQKFLTECCLGRWTLRPALDLNKRPHVEQGTVGAISVAALVLPCG